MYTYIVLSSWWGDVLLNVHVCIYTCIVYLFRCSVLLTAPRNADVPVHMNDGRGNVTVEFVPNEVGQSRDHITYHNAVLWQLL